MIVPSTKHHGPLPIVGDVPTAEPRLGFAQYASALADAIRGGTPPQFTVGLYGAWGSGKSSLLRALEARLRQGSDALPVFFDAWRYERAEHIVVPLLHHVAVEADAAGQKRLASQVRKALLAVISSLSFKLGVVEIDPRVATTALSSERLPALDTAFSEPFAELQKIAAALKNRRIVVLIDDLDRCSPEKVVSMLEVISLVMDVPGIIFVLALDYDVLVEAVKIRYPHVNGHQFIEKMVQLPFRVPPLHVAGNGFFGTLLPNWTDALASLPDSFPDVAAYIASQALRSNPRQVKRFLNSLLVIQRVIDYRETELDIEALAAVIGLQLAWPDAHRSLHEAVLAGEEEPLSVLNESTNRSLERYKERFFAAESIRRDTLVDILRLTQTVVQAPTTRVSPARASSDPRVRAARAQVEEELQKCGFIPDERRITWAPPGNPAVRLRFRRRGVRLEGSTGSGWFVRRTFDLTQQPVVSRLLAELHQF
jgi:hypothetical protein